jgi:hypothetical protein
MRKVTSSWLYLRNIFELKVDILTLETNILDPECNNSRLENGENYLI